MEHLIFIEYQPDVAWVRQQKPDLTRTRLVAVTTEAMVALEQAGLPHTPAAHYTDLHQLAAADERMNRECLDLLTRIETFTGDRLPRAKPDGPGILTGNVYYLQYLVSAIVKRALIYRDAICANAPQKVTVFQRPPYPWIAVDVYSRNPWIDWINAYARLFPFRLDIVIPDNRPLGRGHSRIRNLIDFSQFLYHGVKKRITRYRVTAGNDPHGPSADLDGLRLLFIDTLEYDWGSVVRRLSKEPGVSCFAMEGLRMKQSQEWSAVKHPSLREVRTKKRMDLNIPLPVVDEAEALELAHLLSEWIETEKPRLDVLNMDVLPYLLPQIRSMLRLAPSILRFVDSSIEAALTTVRPHAVCFFNISNLANKRIAHLCHQRGIPVVCFQHGFGYGIYLQPKDESSDQFYADYFLTYGKKIQPRENPLLPVRARFVPIGSTRIEAMRAVQRPRPRNDSSTLKVLWIAEFVNHNTRNICLAEETRRFNFYRQCFNLLARHPGLEVIYRPYRSQPDSFVDWLDHQNFHNVKTNTYQNLNELIETSDLAVVTASSQTTWGEVLGLKTPMVLYCDPKQVLLTPSFIRDLEKACDWCRTPEELIQAITRLVRAPRDYVDEIRGKETGPFIRDYILHERNCAERAISFLNRVCRHHQPYDQWESQGSSNPGRAGTVLVH